MGESLWGFKSPPSHSQSAVKDLTEVHKAHFIRQLLKSQRGAVIPATVLALFLGINSAAIAALIGPTMQLLMNSPDKGLDIPLLQLFGPGLARMLRVLGNWETIKVDYAWALFPVLLAILAFFRAIGSAVQIYFWEFAGESISKNLRQDIVDTYLVQNPMRRLESLTTSDSMMSSLVTTDIRFVREYLVRFYGGLPRELVQIFFYIALAVALSWKFFLLFVLVLLPAALAMQKLARSLRRRATRALNDYAEMSEWLQQRMLGIETIKHYQTEDIEDAKMRVYSEKLAQKFMRAAQIKAATSPVLEFFAVTGMALVIFVSLRELYRGETTAAVQFSFFSAIAMLAQSAGKLGRYINSSREGAAAIDRILKFMDDCREKTQREVRVEKDHSGKLAAGEILRCSNVSLTYAGSKSSALHGVNISFATGKIYAIVGKSGSGKSSLVRVILGLASPQFGEILYGKGIAQSIGYVPQKIHPISVTIGENVAFPEQRIDEERFHNALAQVGLKDVIEHIPGGFELRIGTELRLSGGQEQRLFLARAIYHRYPLIVVDEGTSALDPETEQIVYNCFRKLRAQGTTIIIVSHRRSIDQLADVIIEMERGRCSSRNRW